MLHARRLMACVHSVYIVSEAGVITVALLEIRSGTNPEEAASPAKNQQQLAALIASLATTLVAFCLTLLGAGSALSGFVLVMKRVSSTGHHMARITSSRRISSIGTELAAELAKKSLESKLPAAGSESLH